VYSWKNMLETPNETMVVLIDMRFWHNTS